jgi:hypothetical protein
MKLTRRIAAALFLASALAAGGGAAQGTIDPKDVKAPQPTVPEIFTLQGQYIRVAYNNEGYAILSYRIANGTQGQDWMLLEAGLTVRKGVPGFEMKREAISLKTPDGKSVPLATQDEYAAAGYLPALNARLKTSSDPINYFPMDAQHACAMTFFNDLGKGRKGLAYDYVTLSFDRGCVGRLFFKVPGGVVPGQFWLEVKFPQSKLEVPFRILTKDEEKMFKKEWQNFKKALDEGTAK